MRLIWARISRLIPAVICLGLVTAACGSGPGNGPHSLANNAAADHFDGQTHELLVDSSRGAIWFAIFDGTRATLHEYVKNAGVDTLHQLGSSTSSGLNSHLRFAPDGSIWVTDDYQLFRFDPTTGKVSTVSLPQAVAGALPAATDSSAPLPGTWVSALSFDSAGDIVLARNNVPFLQIIDSSGQVLRTEQLPKGYDGVSDMAIQPSGLRVLASHTNATQLGEAPQTTAVTIAAASSWQRDSTLRASYLGGLQAYFADGSTFDYERGGATATWTNASGTPTLINLPSHTEQTTNPLGKPVEIVLRPSVIAAAPDGSNLWLVETGANNGSDLILQQAT